MFVRQVLIFSICLFVLSGCVYDDEPMPRIVHDYMLSSKIVKPSSVKPFESAAVDYGDVPGQWFPPSRLENKSRWQGIIIHHSESFYGSAAHIDKYHKSRGWDGLGYHFVINNGVFKNGYGERDGVVEVGYRWRGQKTGAHCKVNGDHSNYWNRHTIGICLIGDFEQTLPTKRQWQSLIKLVRFLQQRYNIPANKICGHRDIEPTACPGKNFSMPGLKAALAR